MSQPPSGQDPYGPPGFVAAPGSSQAGLATLYDRWTTNSACVQ